MFRPLYLPKLMIDVTNIILLYSLPLIRNTPLHYASSGEQEVIVNLLLNAGADPSPINVVIIIVY